MTTRRVAIVGLVLSAWSVGGARPHGQTSAWKAADPAYRLELPRDHASHPDYRLEWWYYTGNLETRGGRRFGFQVTFFRVGVDPRPANPSKWAVRDLYITHLAITDIQEGRFLFTDRINRAGVGWAGASPETLDVWNAGWRATLDAQGRHVLDARAPDFGIDLRLEAGKPWVRHGVAGYSRKGQEPGNASHYYSLTRMPTTGRLVVGERTYDVSGVSWMDHEFGSTFLEDGQRGWDWFSIQLDEGTDLMLYRFRRGDGRLDPHSAGLIVRADGTTEPIGAADFVLEPGRFWDSPATGARYPVEWTLRLPSRQLVLTVRAALADQELRTTRSTGVSYWEGSVGVEGQWRGRQVRGRGYLEMTGYSGKPLSEVLR